jgi:hypothetical protein
MMNPTSIPGLTVPEFNGYPLNLATLGLDLSNPEADRVRDGLDALRSKALKATKGPVSIRKVIPGLNPREAQALGQAISRSQFSAGVGIEGKKIALEIAVRIADTLDAFYGYKDRMAAVVPDLSDVGSYVDERCWAATPRHLQNLVRESAVAAHKASLKHIDQEIDFLTTMLNEVDAIGGVALELFERRRMQRAGVRPKAIEVAIAEMKADGRIPVKQEGGPQC